MEDVADEPDKPGGGAEDDDAESGGAAPPTEENERPTVSPPFDPIAFARDILHSPDGQSIPQIRDPHGLVTPPQGTEQQAASIEASKRSGASPKFSAGPSRRKTPVGLGEPDPPGGKPSEPPPPLLGARPPPRIKTPTSTLSLANARIPSNLPPREPKKSPIPVPPPIRESASPNKNKLEPPPPPKRAESLTSMNAVDREWADLEIATRPPPADGPDEDPVIEIVRDRAPKLDLDDIDLGDEDDDDDDEHAADTVRRPVPADIAKQGVPSRPSADREREREREQREKEKAATPQSREREMADRVSLGDYSGALEIAEKILDLNPEDSAAKQCAENCRTVLRQMYATRIGPLDRVPVVMIARDQLRWLSIDHKAGFVLSLVDGVSTLEMIIDVSGMAELDTLRILSELAQQRIISLR
jgi:hypothetical protein